MADPITLLQVISASTNLVAQCAQVIKGLHDLAGKFTNAELSILSIAHELDTIRLAWERIEVVLKTWEGMVEAFEDSDRDLLARLRQNLAFGDLTVSSLAEDMNTFAKRPFTFGQRSRYVWNEEKFRCHQDRIRGQVGAMNLLVSVLNLSSAPDRATLLKDGDEILRKSDESAYSIVPSYLSSRLASLYSNPSALSVDSAELVYRQLTIDDDLFTARVYKRNYRHPFKKLQKRLRPPHAVIDEGGQSSTHAAAAPLPSRQSRRASSDGQLNVAGDHKDWQLLAETPLGSYVIPRWFLQSSPWVIKSPSNSSDDATVEGPAVSMDLKYALKWTHQDRMQNLQESVSQCQSTNLQQLLQLLAWGFHNWRKRFLREACDQKRIDLVELLIENDQSLGSWLLTRSGFSVDQCWSFAYDVASAKLLQLLCIEGAKLNSASSKAKEILQLACSKGQTEIVESLRFFYEGLPPHRNDALLAAAYNFHPEIVQLLLDDNCDVNATRNGPPLLLDVVLNWSHEIIAADVAQAIQVLNIFLHHGADITRRTLFGNNLYHFAAAGPNLFSVEALHAIEVDPMDLDVALHARNSNGDTPRSVAEAHSNKVFLSYVNDVNTALEKKVEPRFVPRLKERQLVRWGSDDSLVYGDIRARSPVSCSQ